MTGSLNKVSIIGNLGKDPEIRTTPSGKKVANFSVCTSDRWTDKEGKKQESAQWHKLVAWGPLAEIIEKYVRKGSQAYFEGKLDYRKYMDKKDNIERYSTEIVVSEMQMLGVKSAESAPQSSQESMPIPPDDSDLPF